MALILSVVMLIIFQAYTTNVMSDMGAGNSLDRYTQYQGERVAIERLVKEALMEFYEQPRMGQAVASVQTLLDGFLNDMSAASGINYVAAVPANLPSNGTTFWNALDPSGTTPIGGAFHLFQVDVSAFPPIAKRRVAQYMPDPAHALSVAGATVADDTFEFIINRTGDGNTVRFNVYVRMFQVPATDFNVISYAIADDAAHIPNTPPALNAGVITDIATGTIHALCMSKMGGVNAINSTLDFPYSYRELFSAASMLWEWTLYHDTYIRQYFPSVSGIYGAYSILDLGAINMPVAVDGISCLAVTHVDGGGNVIVDSGVWTIDLDAVPDIFVFTDPAQEASVSPELKTIRRIYIQLATTLPAPPSTLVIRDNNPVEATSINKRPIVIWINGWDRGDMAVPPANYSVRLQGNLTNQPVLIFASGVNIVTDAGTSMNGVIILDDKLADLAPVAGATFTLNGLLAWNGASATVDSSNIVVNPYQTSVTYPVNPFRSVAPRFLLVDAQSRATINPNP
ncbi:MAG: hypothetical protein WC360_02715 [Opitutales bacterium]